MARSDRPGARGCARAVGLTSRLRAGSALVRRTARRPVRYLLDFRDLSDGALQLLKVMVTHDDPGLTAEDLATACGITATKGKYYLDTLLDRDFVTRQLFMGAPAKYRLSRAGRKHLVDAGFL
jgi:hypothetical protein